ncbi:agamous-like MADS-box protein AGL92 [Solanum lycopersicum]|uniref:agamous-like MADS-box protein AGL92 n=1 Tax=Solanum lycopersicum TaxID=4081 RepID=UPI003748010F
MGRKKVKLAFIENNTERRVSYRKRIKGFLTKARELNILCDVEMATLVYNPYQNEPEIFPNHEASTDLFTKFSNLPEEDKSKNMKTQENVIMKRIKKIEKELEKVRQENKKMEYTNHMYGLLNGEEMPNSKHPEYLNDLCYVINKNLKLIDDSIEAKTHEEGSTSNAPQPFVGPMDSGGTNFDISWAPLLAHVDDPVLSEIPLLAHADVPVLSEIPLLVPSTVPGRTNFEGPRAPLNLVPDVIPTSMVTLKAPLMGPSSASAQVPEFMKTPLPSDLSLVPSSSSSQRYAEIAYTMAYPMSSPMLVPPVAPQLDQNILSMSASEPMENNVNDSFVIQKSPSFSELLSFTDDQIQTLIDDTSFNTNVQESNPHHNNL